MSEEKERVAKYRAVYVTEITDTLHFYTQDVETGNAEPCLCMKQALPCWMDVNRCVCCWGFIPFNATLTLRVSIISSALTFT